MHKTETGQAVHSFYQTLHFNEGTDAKQDAEAIQSAAIAKAQLLPTFQNALQQANARHGTVFEAGCGIGWLALSVEALYPDINLHAFDFSERALSRAHEIAQARSSAVTFQQCNLLDRASLGAADQADAFFSIGVLHHTGNFKAAFQNCLSLLKPGGDAYVGLYHTYRRAPFLAHFKKLSDAGKTEQQLRQEYARIDRRTTDPIRQESWFKDQVLHPHETQHTVQEVLDIAGPSYCHISNSLTGEQLPGTDQLALIEKRQTIIGEKNLTNTVYDPGFFMVHLRKEA
ncbi:MAG: class I SAM-dependent methyltransferase [Kordiimonadaceae bacterium]|nr:class I SAM-dependent methyltransferase [Kordiimonadaceae bacterium]